MITIDYLINLFISKPYIPRNLWLYEETPLNHSVIFEPNTKSPIHRITVFDFDGCIGILLEHNDWKTFRIFINEYDLEIHSMPREGLDGKFYLYRTIGPSTYAFK